MQRMLRISILLVLGWAVGVSAQAGHRVTASQVVVNSRAHWQNWSFPPGVLELGADGSVRPQKLRRDINAVQDIVDHLRLRPSGENQKRPRRHRSTRRGTGRGHGEYRRGAQHFRWRFDDLLGTSRGERGVRPRLAVVVRR